MGLLQTVIGTSSAATFLSSPETIVFGFLKLLFIVGALIYLIFAGLVIRQIGLMSQTIKTTPSSFMKFLGFIHFAIAGLVLLTFIIIL